MALPATTPTLGRMTFNFRLIIEGLDSVLVQKVNIPDAEIVEVTQSSGGSVLTVKQPGKKKYGDITVEKLMSNADGDKWADEWFNQVRNNDGTAESLASRRNITIEHIAADSATVLDRWLCEECWPKKITYSGNDATQEGELTMQTVTLSCYKYERI